MEMPHDCRTEFLDLCGSEIQYSNGKKSFGLHGGFPDTPLSVGFRCHYLLQQGRLDMLEADCLNRPRRSVGSALPAVLIGLAGLSMSPAAFAISDFGNYTGAACQPSGAQSDIRYGTFGEANNNSTTSARAVVCPARTDSDRSYAEGNVTVRKHSNDTVACTLHYRDSAGQSGVSTNRRVSGTGLQSMFFSLSGFYNGQVHYLCSLPKSSGGSNTGIISYELDQY